MTETSYRRFGLLMLGIAALGLIAAAIHGGFRTVGLLAAPDAVMTAAGFVLLRLARSHRKETLNVLALLENAAVSGFTVAPIASELELLEFWTITRDMYGAENALRFESFLAWWRSYPQGVLGLFEKGALVGGASIWPLRRRSFYDALRGRRTISPRAFLRPDEARRCGHWYVAGVVIKPGFRRRDALHYLFCEIMRHGLDASREVMRLNLCAAASSPEGGRLLRRFGFAPVAAAQNAPPQLTAYALLDLGPARLRKMADRFAGKR